MKTAYTKGAKAMYLVFDVGATFIKYAWMTSEGEILEKSKTPTPVARENTVEDFVRVIGNIYDMFKDKGILDGIAMGLPGQIDVKNGIVYTGGGLRYMDDVPLQQLLQERCDNVPVALENDGKCAALAEVWLGNAKDVKDACVLVFGTGIGGALIKNRRVIHGKHLLSGEVSFIFEDMTREEADTLPEGYPLMEARTTMEVVDELPYTWATKRSTINMCHFVTLKKGLPDEAVTGEQVYAWAKAGDEDVINILEDMYFSIAKQCMNLYVIFDPEVILIGGGISEEPEFLKGIQRYIDKLKRLSCVYKDICIDSCKFLNDSNLLGALYNFKLKYELEV